MHITKIGKEVRRIWDILRLAGKTFWRIDGVQWAGAFAFNAFFSLFPLMILLVTIASFVVDKAQAEKAIIDYMGSYVSMSGAVNNSVSGTIAGVIEARGQAGVVVSLIMVWAALQCFITLVCATHRAWGSTASDWWRLPLKSLALLGITALVVLLSLGTTVFTSMTEGWLFSLQDLPSWLNGTGGFVVPLLVTFIGLSTFYRIAPQRRMRFADVWVGALCATVLLQVTGGLFVGYLKNFATLNAVYGAFGGVMALLLWIYLCGCIFIFGVCLCAAQAAGRSVPVTVPDNSRNLTS